MKKIAFLVILILLVYIYSYSIGGRQDVKMEGQGFVLFYLLPESEFNCRLIGRWQDNSPFPSRPAWDMK